MAGESGQAYDKNYNLITVLQQSLENVWALSTYIDDAQDDDELKSFLEEVKRNNEEGARRAKQLLSARLEESGE